MLFIYFILFYFILFYFILFFFFDAAILSYATNTLTCAKLNFINFSKFYDCARLWCFLMFMITQENLSQTFILFLNMDVRMLQILEKLTSNGKSLLLNVSLISKEAS